MKANRRLLLPLGLGAIIAAPVISLAIEPPDDNAPPPNAPAAKAERPAELPAAPAIAFLGINTQSVPDMLAAHLGLEPGQGIVVRTVHPEGPAAKAGIAVHDVITRIAGKAIASHDELVREIQQHQPGEELAIDLIHQGKPAAKNVTLVPRPDGVVAPPPEALGNLMLEGMPGDQAKRIREMIERQLKAFEGAPGDIGDDEKNAAPKMDGAMKDIEKQMKDALKRGLGGDMKLLGGATIKMIDGDGSIEFHSNAQGKEATVRDKAGKVVWSGPWDTEQDKAAAPPDVRARLERVDMDMGFKGPGMRFNFGGGGNAPKQLPNNRKADGDDGNDAPEAPEAGPME